ncbi:MAG: aminopeptidase P family N-terminal domain-containing protein, partial [Anaerolineae bacterium]|nr:aminopeptidase P family N-terminal domain-containing protein [Anaerolineae bacterium]
QVLVLAALDDIAWTLNIRGSDVTCNPVAVSYAVITGSEARLFVDADKVPADVSTALTADGVTLAPYEAIEDYLQELPAGATVLIDP